MLLTLYPNFELRARIPAPPLSRRRQAEPRRWKDVVLPLSIVENLRSKVGPSAFAPEKQESLRPGYGGSPKLREFSVYARRQIARCGGAFGLSGGRASTVFFTGTIPGGTDEALEAVSRWSSWIVHELLTHIPRMCRIRASECQYLWVWEWQERGALHWHCVMEFPSRDIAKIAYQGFKSLWVRCLESVGRFASVDIAERLEGGTHRGNYRVWRTRAEWARKNPARYLAKYMGKVKTPSSVKGKVWPPVRWYGISRCLLGAARALTKNVCSHGLKGSEEHKVTSDDIGLLERLFGLSSVRRAFPDKVRDGFTFVFYFDEKKHMEVLSLMNEYSARDESVTAEVNRSARRAKVYALTAIGSYPRLLDRFLTLIGDRALSFYGSWVDGQEIPDDELFFLNQAAHSVFLWEGWGYRGQPPERSEAGLPGRGEPTMVSSSPPSNEWDQSAMFPW